MEFVKILRLPFFTEHFQWVYLMQALKTLNCFIIVKTPV